VFSRIFQALTYREFRIMWLGACTSSIGTWLQKAAQSWLVYDLSHSTVLLGLDQFLGEIPILLFSLFGGVASDRFDRRKILIGSQLGQMLAAFTLALLFFLGFFESKIVWPILALSFVTGFSQAFGGPAYQSLLPMMVPKDAIQNAIAMNSLQFNVARVIGPTIAGVALLKWGPAWCFTLNGLSFLAVIFSLMMISEKRGGGKKDESVLASIRKGIDFIRNTQGLDALIVLAFCMTALGLPIITFLPVIAREVFQRDAELFTKFLVASGLGSICGALAVAATGHIRRKGRAALINLIVLGALVSVFALSRNVWLSYAAIFFAGATLMCVFAYIASVVQNLTTDDMRGRVMSVYNVAFRGGGPIGALIAGELIALTSAPTVLLGCGGLLMVLGGYFLLVNRRVAAL
jgi:predicted MFS family arabinose efflux permease